MPDLSYPGRAGVIVSEEVPRDLALLAVLQDRREALPPLPGAGGSSATEVSRPPGWPTDAEDWGAWWCHLLDLRRLVSLGEPREEGRELRTLRSVSSPTALSFARDRRQRCIVAMSASPLPVWNRDSASAVKGIRIEVVDLGQSEYSWWTSNRHVVVSLAVRTDPAALERILS